MKNKVLIVSIIILIGIITFEGVFIFINWNKESNFEESYINIPGKDENNSDNYIKEEAEDYVKLVNIVEDGNQIIQEYEMVLNGEYQEFNITFEINVVGGYLDIKSILKDTYLFLVYYDNSDLKVHNYLEYIEKYFNENNFIIFPGTDGINYLIIQSYDYLPTGGVGIDYNIFNQNWDYIGYLNVVYHGQGIILEDDSIWYPNNLNIDTIFDNNKIRSKIEGDKIYNLYYTCDYIEERIYEINNSKLEYELINRYKILEVAGATC